MTSGRRVSFADIARWRQNGLLPQLAHHGLGQGKGKAHCWHDADIVARAELVCDTIRQYGRNDMALLMLFLSGFSVPLPQLRRAWAFRCKLRKPPAIRPMPVTVPPNRLQDGNPLLEAALAVATAIQTDHHLLVMPLLERALAKLGYSRRGNSEQLIRAMMAMEAALDASDLVRSARDEELLEAQHYLSLAVKFLRGCAGPKGRDSLVANFGPSLFGFILAFLRSGQIALIERAAARIAAADRPCRTSPPSDIRLHA
jgi:hypothetical protein